ncbi:beta-ketoacyl synthase chain length factor [Salinicola tamaricis]|uniref:beta-ketoacyl synthase chain length factor n=1 Tax=Salinicola tamaricis TaxID=1771309 RepID=UPI000D09B776|nr:beta-ketoacyl synthase chain length factor [Salinicola tamaricis]
MTELFVEEWRGWTPHRDAAGEARLDTSAKPAGTAIPSMLRRRLNLIGRAVCDMLIALDPAAKLDVLHASRHGDGERTLEMLYAIDAGEPLSPARFGLSVHNAIIGVYSIASGNRRSQQAVAASGAEWAALMAEAQGYLSDGTERLLVVFGDQPVPARFADFAPHTPAAAVALVLSTTPAPGTRRLAVSAAPEADGEALQPLDVIDWLMQRRGPLSCPLAGRTWTLAPDA